jgi:hypothetical protein
LEYGKVLRLQKAVSGLSSYKTMVCHYYLHEIIYQFFNCAI